MAKLTRRRLLQAASGCLLISVTPTIWAQGTAGAQMLAVRLWPASAYTRMTLESNQNVKYKYFILDSPSRLVVDIEGMRLNDVLQTLAQKVLAEDPYIKAVRVGQFNPETVRIVMELKQAINPQVFTLPPVDNIKHRLVVDLYPSQSTAIANINDDPLMALLEDYNKGKVRQDGSTTVTAQTSIPEEKVSPPKREETGQVIPKAKNRQVVIMLDPGHGGEDPGALGPGGLREKDIVLAIARETRKKLQANGYKVYMTRDEDVFIPLTVRVAKARKLNADIFISIHADAFTNPSARGTGVYALSTKGATSAAAKFLEGTQNKADVIGGVKSVGDPSIDKTLFDMTQTATINDSLKLGKLVLKELGTVNKLHKGQIDQANFAVLKAPDIPSILVETAFISNPEEAKLLSSSAFRIKMGDAIARGVKQYLAGASLSNR